VPGTIPWKGARLGHNRDLDNPIWSKVFKNEMFRELPPSMRTRLRLTSLTMGLTMRGYCLGFGTKSGWSLLEGDGDLRPFKVLEGGGRDRHDLPAYEFLLPP
jgi:hypothetical protein